MMVESGQVVDVGDNHVWVECLQGGRCEGCSSKTVCCQGIFGAPASKESYLKILLAGRNPNDYPVGTHVEFGVSEGMLVKSVLLLYFLPLLSMLLGAWIGQMWYGSDKAAVFFAVTGLAFGGLLVKKINASLQGEELLPVLIDKNDID